MSRHSTRIAPGFSRLALLGRLAIGAQFSTPVVVTRLTAQTVRIQVTGAPLPLFLEEEPVLIVYRSHLRVKVNSMLRRSQWASNEWELHFRSIPSATQTPSVNNRLPRADMLLAAA
jgi:hypothetical protein